MTEVEREMSDKQLVLECERLAEAMTAWGIGVYDHDHVTGDVYVSDRFKQLYGFDVGDEANKLGVTQRVSMFTISQAVHPADRVAGYHEVLKAHDPTGDGKFDLLYRILRKDGDVRWVHSRSTTTFGLVDGKVSPLRTMGSVQDITEHQELEVVVQRQRIRLEQAIATSAVGIFELDHRPSYDAEGIYLSETFSRLTGLTAPFSRDFADYLERVDEADAEKVAEAFRQLLSPEGPGHIEVEHRFIVPGEEGRWFLLRASTTFETKDPSPGALLTVGALLDLTSTQKARMELADRSAILDATPDFVCITRPNGELLYLNQAGRDLYGFSADEDVTVHNMEMLHDVSTNRFIREEVLPIAMSKGSWRGETTFINCHGEDIPMSQVLLAHPRGKDGELRFSTIARNLSKEKELEEQIRQAQKMEAVGQLAGGVAHDFNNLLSIIFGFADLGDKHLSEGHPSATSFREIRVAAGRASALTSQLLAFSRRQIMQPRIIDVGNLLERATPMFRRAVSERIEFSVAYPAEQLRIKADPNQVEQILLNLVVNARDAMPRGGQLRIDLTERVVTERLGELGIHIPIGTYVVIAVSDTGHGMSQATRERIFEPFFTTKEQGKGTGLGLAMVFGIVRQSGGGIYVRSEQGVGTTFDIYLPRTRDVESERPAAPRSNVNVTRATILVAEDDAQVRRMIVAVLEEAGLFVLDASGPLDALRLAQGHDGSIDLLLTDVVMPEMTGRELAEKLCARRPDVQVVYMSGYTEDTIVHDGVLDEGIRFLPKPINTQQLLSAIKDALGQ